MHTQIQMCTQEAFESLNNVEDNFLWLLCISTGSTIFLITLMRSLHKGWRSIRRGRVLAYIFRAVVSVLICLVPLLLSATNTSQGLWVQLVLCVCCSLVGLLDICRSPV